MNCHRNSIYLPRNILVSGRESVLHLDNYVELGFLPKGGDINEVLVKCSSRDYNCRWENLSNLIPSLSLVFHNGLTEVSGDVVWGGVLDQNTVIEGASTYSIDFSNLSEFTSISAGDSSIYAGNNNQLTSANNTIINAGNNLNIGVGADMGVNVTDSYNIQSTDYTNVGTNSFNIEALNLFTLTTNSVDMTEAFPGSFLQILDTTTGEAEWSNYSMPLTDGLEDQILVVQADGNLDWEYPNLTDVGNTLFVSKLGDDATAQRESLDKHFLTLHAANAAAQDGDIVIVYPGVYSVESTQIAIRPNTNYEFKAGAIIQVTATEITDEPIKFSGTQSITGAGELILDFTMPASYYDLTNRLVAGSKIDITLKAFTFNKVLFFEGELLKYFSLTCEELNTSAGFRLEGLVQSNTFQITSTRTNYEAIGVGLVPLASITGLEGECSATLNMGDVFVINKAIKAPLFLSSENEEEATFKLNVNSLGGTPLLGDPNVSDKMRYAIYENTLCFAKKDISIKGYHYSAIIYQPVLSYSTSLDREKGNIVLEGVVLDNGAGLGGCVKLNIPFSYVNVKVDLVNKNSSNYFIAGDADYPNSSFVHLSGKIESVVSTDAPVLIGAYSESSVLFRDFLIHTSSTESVAVSATTLYPSVALNNLGNAANVDVEATPAATITQPIETLFVNSLLR